MTPANCPTPVATTAGRVLWPSDSKLVASVLLAFAWVCSTLSQTQQYPPGANSPASTNVVVFYLSHGTNAYKAWKLVLAMRADPGIEKGRVAEMEREAVKADVCREFVRRFYDDERAYMATEWRKDHLMRSIELGNTNRIQEFEDMYPPATQVAKMRAYRVYSLGKAAIRAEWEKNLRALEQYPTSCEYDLLQLALQSEPEKARQLAQELIDKSSAKATKANAAAILKKYEPVGKPVHLKVTAADGREIDLEQWKGKVVLLHFWRAPEQSAVTPDREKLGFDTAGEVFTKFQSRGLEVLGINYNASQQHMDRLLNENKIAWPQYWASTNLSAEWQSIGGVALWELRTRSTNRAEVGLNARLGPGQVPVVGPAFSLVDKDGILRDLNVPPDELLARAEKLLK